MHVRSVRPLPLLLTAGLSSGVALSLHASCGDDTNATGSETGGRGGAGGAGATSSSTTTSITTSSVTTGPQGEEPIWGPTNISLAGCPTSRLVNRGRAKAFSWVPCDDGSPGCEQSQMQLGGRYDPWSGGVVQDDFGVRIHMAVGFASGITPPGPQASGQIALFADAEGWLFDAYMMPTQHGCDLGERE